MLTKSLLKEVEQKRANILKYIQIKPNKKATKKSSAIAKDYIKAYLNKDKSFDSIGLCGRFSASNKDGEDFTKFIERNWKTVYIAGSDMLQSTLGHSPIETLLHFGLPLDWVEFKVKNGHYFRYFVFPE